MIKINIDIPYTNITNYLVVFGNMEDDERTKVILNISEAFLEDIANGRTDYSNIFEQYIWTIEKLAEQKHKTNRDIVITEHGIKITILAADKAEFDAIN